MRSRLSSVNWCLGSALGFVFALAAGTGCQPGGGGQQQSSPDLASFMSTQETEPNNGTTTSEHGTLTLGGAVTGAVGTPDDVDVFFVDVAPGTLVTATVSGAVDSALQPHLTVIDAGRGSAAAGEDYIKIVKSTSLTKSLTLSWLAMGQGGYYVVVRDTRNVGGPGGAGGASATYTLTVSSETAAPKKLSNGASGVGTLASAGAVQLYEVELAGASNLVFDVKHTGAGAVLDGRVIVYSFSESDWVARQDDRTSSDFDPLVDAPLQTTGKHWIVVENLAPTATELGFSYSISL